MCCEWHHCASLSYSVFAENCSWWPNIFTLVVSAWSTLVQKSSALFRYNFCCSALLGRSSFFSGKSFEIVFSCFPVRSWANMEKDQRLSKKKTLWLKSFVIFSENIKTVFSVLLLLGLKLFLFLTFENTFKYQHLKQCFMFVTLVLFSSSFFNVSEFLMTEQELFVFYLQLWTQKCRFPGREHLWLLRPGPDWWTWTCKHVLPETRSSLAAQWELKPCYDWLGSRN